MVIKAGGKKSLEILELVDWGLNKCKKVLDSFWTIIKFWHSPFPNPSHSVYKHQRSSNPQTPRSAQLDVNPVPHDPLLNQLLQLLWALQPLRRLLLHNAWTRPRPSFKRERGSLIRNFNAWNELYERPEVQNVQWESDKGVVRAGVIEVARSNSYSTD